MGWDGKGWEADLKKKANGNTYDRKEQHVVVAPIFEMISKYGNAEQTKAFLVIQNGKRGPLKHHVQQHNSLCFLFFNPHLKLFCSFLMSALWT